MPDLQTRLTAALEGRFAPDGSSVLLAAGGSTGDILLWREGKVGG